MKFLSACMCSALISVSVFANETDHDHIKQPIEVGHQHNNKESDHKENSHAMQHDDQQVDHQNQAPVELSAAQIALANIRISALKASIMSHEVYAPGEIKANGYSSYLVSPRVDSVVLQRHAALGSYVEKGQPLVTLFSEKVAQAQGDFVIANSQWQRIKKMNNKSVSVEKRVQAKIQYQAAYGQLMAFGLSKKAIQLLNKPVQSLGQYTLMAEISGAVLSDDFRQGQRVEAGQALMELADEHQLWIEARLTPSAQLELPVGTQANVKVGESWFKAKVTQQAHTIDPLTRTRVVRLLVNNDEHLLHPGLFADVYFSFASKQAVMAVPESALIRSDDGDWTVFIETEPRQFEAKEITLGKTLSNGGKKWLEIIGLSNGSRVVMEGAFFIASQAAKSGFDPHNH